MTVTLTVTRAAVAALADAMLIAQGLALCGGGLLLLIDAVFREKD